MTRPSIRLPEALVLFVAAVPRVWAAIAEQGLFWPDEFYQSLEQAHRFAFGYGIVPWEFAEGARSWLFPGLIGILWKAMALVGLSSAPALVIGAKLAMAALSVFGVFLTMRLTLRLVERITENAELVRWSAILAGLLAASFPALIFFGSKCMTETAAAPALVGAMLLVTKTRSSEEAATAATSVRETKRALLRTFAAGAILSLAIFLRYQTGLFAVAMFLLVLSELRWKEALALAAGGVSVGILGGMLDAITWGKPFFSFVYYVQFHAKGGANAWGVAPFPYYFLNTLRSCGPSAYVFAVGLLLALPRFYRQVLVLAACVLVHSFVDHKEYRFITPFIPLAAALTAAGVAWLVSFVEPRAKLQLTSVPLWLGLFVSSALFYRTTHLTFRRLGHPGLAANLGDEGASVWHAAEGINRLLWKAGALPETCGITVRFPWPSTGGFAYFHKDVPMVFDFDASARRGTNMLIARREYNPPENWALIEESREFGLFRREGPCDPVEAPRAFPP